MENISSNIFKTKEYSIVDYYKGKGK